MRAARPRIPAILRRRRSWWCTPKYSPSELERFSVRGDPHVADALVAEDRGHRLEGRSLAVHAEGALDGGADSLHPGAQLGPVRVGRVAADGLDFGADPGLLPEDPHQVGAVLDPAAQRALALIPDEEHAVAVVAAVV